MNVYQKGQRVRCEVEFKVNGTLTDPTTVTFKYKKPDGTVATHVYPNVVVKTATGQYYADVVADQVRQWVFRFEGSGACVAVDEQAFEVRTAFP